MVFIFVLFISITLGVEEHGIDMSGGGLATHVSVMDTNRTCNSNAEMCANSQAADGNHSTLDILVDPNLSSVSVEGMLVYQENPIERLHETHPIHERLEECNLAADVAYLREAERGVEDILCNDYIVKRLSDGKLADSATDTSSGNYTSISGSEDGGGGGGTTSRFKFRRQLF